MVHWKLTLAYHGGGLHGWQIQPGLATVQGTLADALRRVTGETVLPQGAGRTDAGVHALAQVASVSLQAPVPPANLQRALNRILPQGIRVLSAEPVSAAFHARHSACGKLYEYRVFERRSPLLAGSARTERLCSPFLAPFVWDCRWPLQLAPMQAAARTLLGTQDFSAMAASSNASADGEAVAASVPNPVKTIHMTEWQREGEVLRFRIQGSGFLHHMVRNLVGTMVDIGRGSLAVDDLPRILASRNRSEAGPTAPAQGLYLVKVLYASPETQASQAEQGSAGTMELVS